MGTPIGCLRKCRVHIRRLGRMVKKRRKRRLLDRGVGRKRGIAGATYQSGEESRKLRKNLRKKGCAGKQGFKKKGAQKIREMFPCGEG